MEKPRTIFSCLRLQYNYRWKFFHDIRAIDGKFSIYQHCYVREIIALSDEYIEHAKS
jgi:hypothetical protein